MLLLPGCSRLAVHVPAGKGEKLEGVYIQEIQCGAPIPGRTVTLFSEERNFSDGWSHINNPQKAGDFVELQQPYHHYNITPDRLQEDASCGDAKTYSAVLVKKLHTWDNTHSNGLQTQIEPIPVDAIESLVIELKVNSAGSAIPSRQQIAATFPWLQPGQVRHLDKGAANLDLVLSSGTLHANKVLTINQSKYADKWLRITIPMEQLNYYQEENYVRTPSRYRAVQDQAYKSLTITAESHDRKTVQSLTGGTAGNLPLFKEVDIAIHRIAFIVK